MLTQRQEQCFLNTSDVWRQQADTTAGADPQPGGWYKVNPAALRCKLRYTQNDSDPSGAGRIKRRTALTEDSTKYEATADVQDGDVIIDTTLLSGGATNPNRLSAGRVQGEPKIRPTLGQRTTNDLKVQVMTLRWEELPQTIRNYYA